jgi:hypothetical protein
MPVPVQDGVMGDREGREGTMATGGGEENGGEAGTTYFYVSHDMRRLVSFMFCVFYASYRVRMVCGAVCFGSLGPFSPHLNTSNP